MELRFSPGDLGTTHVRQDRELHNDANKKENDARKRRRRQRRPKVDARLSPEDRHAREARGVTNQSERLRCRPPSSAACRSGRGISFHDRHAAPPLHCHRSGEVSGAAAPASLLSPAAATITPAPPRRSSPRRTPARDDHGPPGPDGTQIGPSPGPSSSAGLPPASQPLAASHPCPAPRAPAPSAASCKKRAAAGSPTRCRRKSSKWSRKKGPAAAGSTRGFARWR